MMQLLLYTAEKHFDRLASLNKLGVLLREKKMAVYIAKKTFFINTPGCSCQF